MSVLINHLGRPFAALAGPVFMPDPWGPPPPPLIPPKKKFWETNFQAIKDNDREFK